MAIQQRTLDRVEFTQIIIKCSSGIACYLSDFKKELRILNISCTDGELIEAVATAILDGYLTLAQVNQDVQSEFAIAATDKGKQFISDST